MDEVNTGVPPRTPNQQAWAARVHDLRSPLTVILARVQLLRRRLARGDDGVVITRDLDAIEAAVARLTTAIEALDRDGRPI